MSETPIILRVAVPSPRRRLFDYLPPPGPRPELRPGMRVRVPFGRGERIGILMEITCHSEVAAERLKPVRTILDNTPALDEDIFALADWAAGYYHHPHGEAMFAALPVLLRNGRDMSPVGTRLWRLTAAGHEIRPDSLRRAPRQAAILARMQALDTPLPASALLDGGTDSPLRGLAARGLIESVQGTEGGTLHARRLDPPLILNPAQQHAVDAITASMTEFQAWLLYGVTGSGKTEVYLQTIERALDAGRQVLVLVPEIGLTPQLLDRFRRRFDTAIAVLHSALGDGERLNAWLAARSGEAGIVIGTRSAIFTPLARPGLIVVDEEHDTSFKQQEGFRYSARDLALVRARNLGIPVVLGSATPSFESLHNARQGRFRLLALPDRIGQRHAPIELLDIRGQPMDEGISAQLRARIQHHLAQGSQVMLFLNRRGFAPALLCHDCGHVADCPRCDAHMTLHLASRRLRCHHCGMETRIPPACPECLGEDLRAVGHGTERLEQTLAAMFPDTRILRIDRDSTRRKGELERLLDAARRGHAQILLGTQMLAKGHHFPLVTLVALIDTDQGLFSADFRAGERMLQLITQVAGRAGRAERPGEVLIQTHHPDHPLLLSLHNGDYAAIATAGLNERRQAGLPPFTHIALVRAEAVQREAALTMLQAAVTLASGTGGDVELLGPVPSPMEKRAGRYRAQLWIQADRRTELQGFLARWLPLVESLPEARKVRWSVDVDPVDSY